MMNVFNMTGKGYSEWMTGSIYNQSSMQLVALLEKRSSMVVDSMLYEKDFATRELELDSLYSELDSLMVKLGLQGSF